VAEETIGVWGDPWWLILVKTIVVFAIPLLLAIFTVWFERRILAFLQQRRGPHMAGPFGLLQPFADGIKTLWKEDFSPAKTDKFIFTLAPLLTGLAAFTAWAVIPIGGIVSIGGNQTRLQLGDLPVAVLFILAIAGIGTYGIVLAGWSSSSRYSLLGGLRSAAQMVSYEISMGIAVASVVLMSRTMSTAGIVESQAETMTLFGWESPFPSWNFILLAPAFCIFIVAMLAEANRAPFDMPECESELVGGYSTDYSGFRFAMFYLGEYMNMGTLSAICATLFFGGFHAPWPLNNTGADSGWVGILWFFIKVIAFLFFFIWVRGTVPRYRYDQLMNIGWKTLLPLSLAWVMVQAIYLKARQLSAADSWLRDDATMIGVILLFAIFAAVYLWVQRRPIEKRLKYTPKAQDPANAYYPLPILDPDKKPAKAGQRKEKLS